MEILISLWSVFGFLVYAYLMSNENDFDTDSVAQDILLSVLCGPFVTIINIVLVGFMFVIRPTCKLLFGGGWRLLGKMGKYK
jgi:Na+-translocating ferredoxin:NAD+ oxidoreductase RnfD subunit